MTIIDNDFQFIAARATSERAAREIQTLMAQRLKQFRGDLVAELARSMAKQFPSGRSGRVSQQGR